MVDESIIYTQRWHGRLRVTLDDSQTCPELVYEEKEGGLWKVCGRIMLDPSRIDDIIEAIRHHTPKKESP